MPNCSVGVTPWWWSVSSLLITDITGVFPSCKDLNLFLMETVLTSAQTFFQLNKCIKNKGIFHLLFYSIPSDVAKKWIILWISLLYCFLSDSDTLAGTHSTTFQQCLVPASLRLLVIYSLLNFTSPGVDFITFVIWMINTHFCCLCVDKNQ